MNRQELLDISAKHPAWTLQERGDFFGVSRQAVHDMLKRISRPRKERRRVGRPREPLSPSLRMMSEVEAAYVGALIDTDGCVNYSAGRWRIEFTNTEVELIATILRLTGTGRVYHRNREGHACWDWGVYGINDVAALMKQLQPFSLKVQRVLEKNQR